MQLEEIAGRVARGKVLSPIEYERVSIPVLESMGVKEVTGIERFYGTPKAMKAIGLGEYTGMSYSKAVHPTISKSEIYIELGKKPETVLRTIGHEVAHITQPKGLKGLYGITQAEKTAYGFEERFITKFAERYKLPIETTPPEKMNIFDIAPAKTAIGEARVDIWGKIPTMRESAARRGEILTRKIKLGATFTEPTGKGIEIMSGKQKMVAIQEQIILQESKVMQSLKPSPSGYQTEPMGAFKFWKKLQEQTIIKPTTKTEPMGAYTFWQKLQIAQPQTPKLTPMVGLISLQTAARVQVPTITQRQVQIQAPKQILTISQKPIQIAQITQKPVQIPVSMMRQVPVQSEDRQRKQGTVIPIIGRTGRPIIDFPGPQRIVPITQPIYIRTPRKPPIEPIREIPPTEKPPRERPPEIPKIPIILLPKFPEVDVFGVTKKRKKLGIRKTATITPYATVADMFNISRRVEDFKMKKQNVPSNNIPKLDIMNIRKKKSK